MIHNTILSCFSRSADKKSSKKTSARSDIGDSGEATTANNEHVALYTDDYGDNMDYSTTAADGGHTEANYDYSNYDDGGGGYDNMAYDNTGYDYWEFIRHTHSLNGPYSWIEADLYSILD